MARLKWHWLALIGCVDACALFGSASFLLNASDVSIENGMWATSSTAGCDARGRYLLFRDHAAYVVADGALRATLRGVSLSGSDDHPNIWLPINPDVHPERAIVVAATVSGDRLTFDFAEWSDAAKKAMSDLVSALPVMEAHEKSKPYHRCPQTLAATLIAD